MLKRLETAMGKHLHTPRGWAPLHCLGALAAFLALAGEAQASQSFLDNQVTRVTQAQASLHEIMLWILFVIGGLVYIVMIVAMIKFRHQPGRVPSKTEHHVPLEIAWTIIPTLILVAMAWPTYAALNEMWEVPTKPDLTIEVVGHKWFWEYRYPDHGVQILDSDPVGSPKNLVVPVNKNVNVIITSVDVIHSWWVPALGIKQDAVPGHVNVRSFNVSRPGVYTGQCAELCGTLHGNMLLQVEAMEAKYFDEWLAAQPKTSLEALPRYEPGVIPSVAPSLVPATQGAPGAAFDMAAMMAKGKSSYEKGCVACHQVTGQGLPGAFPPLVGSEWVTGDKRKHIEVIIKGLSGPITVKGQSFNGVMPAGGNLGTAITDEDVAAIATYERNSWGNKAEPVTVDDVRMVRGGH